jgi:hypothetical protein
VADARQRHRQSWFLRILHELTAQKIAQFVIATHSPMLLTFPGATIFSLDAGKIRPVTYQETDHFQITRKRVPHAGFSLYHGACPIVHTDAFCFLRMAVSPNAPKPEKNKAKLGGKGTTPGEPTGLACCIVPSALKTYM